MPGAMGLCRGPGSDGRRHGCRTGGRTGSRGPRRSCSAGLSAGGRAGPPPWDRYDQPHPAFKDYPWMEGAWYDPYEQNVLKGDYPIIGQHTFLNLTASSVALFEGRQIPTATTPFESTQRPFEEEFFGRPN